jgi:hypothetical protein
MTGLKFMQSFSVQAKCHPDQQASIHALLALFTCVSSFIINWKLLFASIASLHPLADSRRGGLPISYRPSQQF